MGYIVHWFLNEKSLLKFTQLWNICFEDNKGFCGGVGEAGTASRRGRT